MARKRPPAPAVAAGSWPPLAPSRAALAPCVRPGQDRAPGRRPVRAPSSAGTDGHMEHLIGGAEELGWVAAKALLLYLTAVFLLRVG